MKVTFVLVLVSLCVVPASFTMLQTAIAFREPIRYEELKYIIKDYIANDEQTMLLADLLTSTQYLIFYKKIIATTEVVNLINYLHGSGVRIVYLVNKIHAFLGVPAFVPRKFSSKFVLSIL
jgi:Insect allergen related repeat, nitrile-specifier detoxification